MPKTLPAAFGSFGPGARRMAQLWLSLCSGEAVPAQRDFDPMAVPDLLPNIWLYKFDETLGDFVCSLAGEKINDAWGGSIRGANFRTVVGPEKHPSALMRWQEVISTPQIQHGVIETDRDGAMRRVAERLVLPMRGDGEVPDRVLGYSEYLYRQTDRNLTPPVWNEVDFYDCNFRKTGSSG